MLTLTSRRAARSRSPIRPGLACGSSAGLARARARSRRAGSRAWCGGRDARRNVAVLGEERLRLVAQGEQRLLGAQPRSRLHERHAPRRASCVKAPGLPGIRAERAVAAVVAAERGERHEDLAENVIVRPRPRSRTSPARASSSGSACRRPRSARTLSVGDHRPLLRRRPDGRAALRRPDARAEPCVSTARPEPRALPARAEPGGRHACRATRCSGQATRALTRPRDTRYNHPPAQLRPHLLREAIEIPQHRAAGLDW